MGIWKTSLLLLCFFMSFLHSVIRHLPELGESLQYMVVPCILFLKDKHITPFAAWDTERGQ